MPKTAIPLGDTPFASPYNVVGKEACNNFYLERAITPNSKVPYYYVSVPGLRIFTSRSSTNVCRGIFRTSNNRLFAQFGNQFTEILSNGTKLVRGTIGTYSGVVSMADNSQQLILVDGEYGYILNFATNVFTKIDEETFQNGATHVTCIDTYFLVNRPNSMQYNWSTPNNGLMWDALDFATKQGIPDDIVALKECHNQLWVFGTYSTEVHLFRRYSLKKRINYSLVVLQTKALRYELFSVKALSARLRKLTELTKRLNRDYNR
jgi:hypothetical protein